MALFTLGSVDVDTCLLIHAVFLFVGLVVSLYYLIGAITHNIPNMLTYGRVCATLFVLLAILGRYFQFTENVLFYALARGFEMSLLIAAALYICEHVAENIFIALSLPFPAIAKHMLTGLRVLLAMVAVVPSIEFAVIQTNQSMYGNTIVMVLLQLTVSILVCFSFAYFTHLVVKYRHWKVESGMNHLHVYAKTLSRKKYETAFVSVASLFYSAVLVWTLLSVFERPPEDPNRRAEVPMCPLEVYVTSWAPMLLVICFQIATHERGADWRNSDKGREEYAATQTIARVAPSPRYRMRRSSTPLPSEEI